MLKKLLCAFLLILSLALAGQAQQSDQGVTVIRAGKFTDAGRAVVSFGQSQHFLSPLPSQAYHAPGTTGANNKSRLEGSDPGAVARRIIPGLYPGFPVWSKY